ncbi:hypothetical protein FC770_13985 [Nocardioides jishulii]|uniref:Septum formation-related domain-containing protein n=1 Tax=Nocardioides jishulii TaxID=2575440 RepID=A0A4U2YLM6_9ACTN|nr:hypothetical protein FCL41_10910 [Nocardioides jishulii]TKI60631.1 hypothetical protein FC770_13985 [Nocardioides jishulii]
MSAAVSTQTRTGRLVAAAIVLMLVLTGCSGDDGDSPEPSRSASGASEQAEPPKPPRRPRVGDCYRLTFDEALAPTAPTKRVKCGLKPTAITYFVGKIERNRAGKPRPVDSARVQRQVARVCPQRLATYVGSSPDELRRSLLRAVWFTPSLEEEAAGADWFRCDVVASGPRRSLLVLPRTMKDVLADPDRRERFALCASGKPGTKSFSRAPCSAPHAWRAVATVDIPGDDYPGKDAIAAAMDDPCSDAATEAADNPLDVQWSQEGPTRAQWRAGQRYGICWVP